MRNSQIILMYHSIGGFTVETGAELYGVSKRRFMLQTQYLSGIQPRFNISQKSYSASLLARDLDKSRNERLQSLGPEAGVFQKELNEISQESVSSRFSHYSGAVITFDDGLADNYENAFPVLKEFSLSAYFFVMPAKIGQEGFMNLEQLKEMSAAGMVIGSHGMTHRILVGLSDSELEREIVASKETLEDQLRKGVDYFSVPRGFYNRKVIDKAREAGYKAVYTSNPSDDDGFRIGRVAVKSDWNLQKFESVVERGLPFQDMFIENCKNIAKNLLGAGAYDKLRRSLLS